MEEVYERHFQSVYRYALSLCRDQATAEDVTNETFLKSVKALDTFRGDCDIRVWLCQIAKNTCFSLSRKAKATVPLDLEIMIESTDGDFTEKLMDRTFVMKIHRCLHEMEEPYKEIFSLRTFGELSFTEIAALFCKTENWARVTYHRAKLKLKEALL